MESTNRATVGEKKVDLEGAGLSWCINIEVQETSTEAKDPPEIPKNARGEYPQSGHPLGGRSLGEPYQTKQSKPTASSQEPNYLLDQPGPKAPASLGRSITVKVVHHQSVELPDCLIAPM
ncbi:hypothetical protein CRENBAI_012471 [Crenichthys baileyi]|uniref:Uncharacterized protein n=1 Tax=Crenichthys baileyi TaxID=28760 RepID=A0AAV9S7Q5_9TELE